MKKRVYMINGFSETREYFLRLLSGNITQTQYDRLMDGEEVTIEDNVFYIENIDGI